MTEEQEKEERRQKRLEVLKKSQGLFKDRADAPQDGLEYQRMMREEWEREE